MDVKWVRGVGSDMTVAAKLHSRLNLVSRRHDSGRGCRQGSGLSLLKRPEADDVVAATA